MKLLLQGMEQLIAVVKSGKILSSCCMEPELGHIYWTQIWHISARESEWTKSNAVKWGSDRWYQQSSQIMRRLFCKRSSWRHLGVTRWLTTVNNCWGHSSWRLSTFGAVAHQALVPHYLTECLITHKCTPATSVPSEREFQLVNNLITR